MNIAGRCCIEKNVEFYLIVRQMEVSSSDICPSEAVPLLALDVLVLYDRKYFANNTCSIVKSREFDIINVKEE